MYIYRQNDPKLDGDSLLYENYNEKRPEPRGQRPRGGLWKSLFIVIVQKTVSIEFGVVLPIQSVPYILGLF